MRLLRLSKSLCYDLCNDFKGKNKSVDVIIDEKQMLRIKLVTSDYKS